jgi:hypothetical protein
LNTSRKTTRHAWLLASVVFGVTASCGSDDHSVTEPHRSGAGGSQAGAGIGPSGAAGSNAEESGGTNAAAGNLNAGGETATEAGRGNDGGEPSLPAGTAGERAGGGEAGAAIQSNLLRGRVVDLDSNRPLARRTVMIGSSIGAARVVARTDEQGAFAVEQPTGVYDVAILESDRSAVSVYVGLSASELVLPHRSQGYAATKHTVVVSGNVSGGTTYPLIDPRDVVGVYLFNEQSAGRYLMSGDEPPYGPNYLAVSQFDVSGAVPHTLLAVGTFGRKDDAPATDPAYAAFAVTRKLTLSDGDDTSVDLPFEPVDLGEISGVVSVPSGYELTAVGPHYRFPYPSAQVTFPGTDYVRQNPLDHDGAFVFEVPELHDAGVVLCVTAQSDDAGLLLTERCGLGLGGDPISLELHAPPALDQPSAGATVDENTLFEWAQFDAGVHRLELWPDTLSTATPGISVFTADTQTTLPDFAALSLNFPSGAAYAVTLTGIGPAASLDAALDPSGPFATIPSEQSISMSPPIDVTLSP